ncbi:MAG: phosphatase [Actinobacteria bacterium HGW-Actinobacteria-2]|nr:MAG: phosphatase [Actinobacteria bacterium HGW-Actinobacteria-2]
MTPPALRALLFDVDGTLAETERDGHRPAYNATFADFGLDWVWDEATYGELLAVTGGKERLRFYLERYRPAEACRADLDELIAAEYAAKTARYQQLLASGAIGLRPGVRRLITEAREAGVILAVTTTTSPGNVTGLLEHALAPGSSEWFAVIAAGDVVPTKKPAPDIYLWALAELGLSSDECLVIEDSAVGLRAARAAGLATVITVNDYTAEEDFAGAVAVLSDLGEPDAPARRLDAPAEVVVDLDVLRAWHAAALLSGR